MLNNKNMKQISKILSLALRHKPYVLGIDLDKNGWADVQFLLTQIDKKMNLTLSFEELCEVVSKNDKQRFSFNEDKTLIRANQGHSIQVDVELEECVPPNTLYHGTATKYEQAIDNIGLISKNRLHVHLSADLETAKKVGKRHGELLVYQVDCKKMKEENYIFYLSKNNVWLTPEVPRIYLKKL